VREPKEGEQGCHLDGNPRNNRLSNLRWGSQADNWEDRLRHGNGRVYAKLTLEQVAEIRLGISNGESAVSLAAKFGVSDTQIRNIRSGRQWISGAALPWPLPNVLFGVTAENQEQADIRIPKLLEIPAAVRWVSFEPLLGTMKIDKYLRCQDCGYTRADMGLMMDHHLCKNPTPTIDWAVVGAESGPHARAMDIGWALGLKLQCVQAGTPFFMKQICQGGKKIPFSQFPAELQVREMPATTRPDRWSLEKIAATKKSLGPETYVREYENLFPPDEPEVKR
jgi:hypothetical protein